MQVPAKYQETLEPFFWAVHLIKKRHFKLDVSTDSELENPKEDRQRETEPSQKGVESDFPQCIFRY